jgi:hypothetical protein
VCASSQWDLTTYSERTFTRDYFVVGTLGKLFGGGTGHSAHQPLGAACKELFVLRGGPAQQFSLCYRHHTLQILPQHCLLSEIILEVANAFNEKISPLRHHLNDSSGIPDIHCGCSGDLCKF